MPKPRSSKLESASARLRLSVRRKPYSGPSLARGIKLLYRRCKSNGTWVVKASSGHGTYWTKAIGQSDDYERADGKTVLTFYEAQELAKQIARGTADGPDSKPPMTVSGALDAYARDLASRGADAANANRVRVHLTPSLAGKPVGLLKVADLRSWREHLIAKHLAPATINRHAVGLRASLELAATLDDRIKIRDVFRLGLKGLPGANKARRMVLPDAEVLRIVEAAYAEDHAFGLLIQVLAETGARISQAARLRCIDLQADRHDPRLLMPTSFKGRQKERSHVAVPITPSLARALAKARGDRPHDAPLLLKRDGTPWDPKKNNHSQLFHDAVARAGLAGRRITTYSLRHSSICRALLKGVPTSVVARTHDTSTDEIEAHYAAYIADFSDALSRKALLQPEPPAAGPKVVPLGR
jgi:integrase